MEGGIANAGAQCKGSVSVIRGLLGGGKAIVGPQGYGRLIIHDKFGKLKSDSGWCKNNFVNAGKAYCVQKVGGISTPNPMDYLEVGGSSQAENDTDTALITPISTSGFGRDQDLSPTASQTTVAGDTLEINYSWAVTGSESINEIGLFNAAAAGTMIGRTVLGAQVDVNNGDTANGLFKVIYA
jgi:hypothetical protein